MLNSRVSSSCYMGTIEKKNVFYFYNIAEDD